MNLDVAIIGASSSGLYAAELLARGGARVGVFEQYPVLEPARRTLIVTPQLQRVLGYEYPEATLHRIDIMTVATPGAEVSITLREADVIIERNLFAQMLLKRAAATSAEIHYGYRFQDVEASSKGARLRFRTSNGELVHVNARAIIGADGIVSRVATAAGIPLPPAEPILHAEMNLPSSWNPNETKVWFDTDDSRYFYWLVPESSERGVIGLVGDGRAKTRGLVETFLDHHGMRATGWQGARVAMHHPRLRPWGRIGTTPVLLIGEAAGQVKVTTVGGTVTGLWGAAAAAQALLTGTSYASALRPLKRELDVHWYIRWLLERLDNHGYDQLVRLINPQIQQLLSNRNRDEMAGAAWRIPLMQPRLLPLLLFPERFSNGGNAQRPLPLTVRTNR